MNERMNEQLNELFDFVINGSVFNMRPQRINATNTVTL